MWWRGWSGANPSVVSPRGRGRSTRGMGGGSSKGGGHSSTALSGNTSRHGDSGGSRSGWNSSSGGGGRSWRCGARLDLSIGGGEERLTLALKVSPPRVFTMARQEKEMGDLKSKG